ncbi:MAG TPA: sugar phosphate nucleotidyltransferase [Candidatus Binatia bacterium]|nr:sugar phosphate nucleotidyltransferase [Candidatus Binatia bacterium]
MSSRRHEVPRNRRYAVIMAGGSGTRFWPWSRSDHPKQLLPLCTTATMLADTVDRVSQLVPRENVLIVTGETLRRAVARELPRLRREQILCEPVGRNTAACIAWAAAEVARRAPDGVMAVLPADHVVAPLDVFLEDLRSALGAADQERCLVTLGIRPTRPETGYGYLRAGGRLSARWPAKSLRRVAAFHEKPNESRAKRFLRAGTYFWNSGMFAWRCDTILEEISNHLPALAKAMKALDSCRVRGRIPLPALEAAYPRLPSISIDHGVMEKSSRVAMVPARFQWNDIGSWDAVAAIWPKDAAGNATRDPLIAIDARDNVVATRGKPVALLGVSGLAVVDAGDTILVCPRARAQNVRALVAMLKDAGLGRLL